MSRGNVYSLNWFFNKIGTVTVCLCIYAYVCICETNNIFIIHACQTYIHTWFIWIVNSEKHTYREHNILNE